jgi:hypothetical protein
MRLRAVVAVLGAAALGLTLLSAASARIQPPLVQRKLDLRSAMPLSADAIVTEQPGTGVGGNAKGSGPPPRIGDNVIVNAPQIGQPAGFVGRNETSITLHGQNLVAGWNDAAGFCGVPILLPLCADPSQAQNGISGYAYSTDGGRSWTDGGAPPPFDGIYTSGDPWLDNNGTGTIYYANLALDAAGNSIGISVHRGGFSGGSFAWTSARSFDSPNNVDTCVNPAPPPPAEIACDFYDKEALAAGKNKNKDDAYVSLTNFQSQETIAPGGCGDGFAQFGFGQIEVWRTHDGGDSWQGPVIAGPERPDSVASCGNLGTLQQSSAPAVGPNGDVYVVWQVGPTFNAAGASSADADIVFAKSTDGGATFSAPTKVADINSSRENPPIGYNRGRVNDHPRIEVAQTGKHKGRIYVTYYSSVSPVLAPGTVTCPAGLPATTTCVPQVLVNIQTYVKYSDDGGATWSAPREIGGPLPATDPSSTALNAVGAVKRHWPDVSVSPGGEVHVVYNEERATQLAAGPGTECIRTFQGGGARISTHSSLVDTWWTFSEDGGASWSMPLKISTGTSFWCTPSGNVASNIIPNMGDYIDAQAGPGKKVYALWSDGRDLAPIPALGPGLFRVAGAGFGSGKS